jgi:hypothetical protein
VEAQGFTVEESDMLLKKNGKKSSIKRTKHIIIRYFFIKDRIASNTNLVKNFRTAEMLVDNFTKPLQGAPLHKFCTEIQGIPSDTTEADLGWESIKKYETKQLKMSKMMAPSPHECFGQPDKDPGPCTNDP